MNRREFLKTFANSTVTLSAAALLGWRIARADNTLNHELLERNFFAMGTQGKMFVSFKEKEFASAAMDAAVARINYLEKKIN